MLHLLLIVLARLALLPSRHPQRRGPARDERGDVPGWVLVTVMTAGLVMVIWSVADDQLSSMLSSALSSVR